MPRDSPGLAWIRSEGRERLATINLVPGNSIYREKLILRKKVEYRVWDPFRSKLAAAIFNGLREFPFGIGTSVLYLGASTGTTISHISDIIGASGVAFGVEHASRVAREFLDRVASHRPNLVPIMQDAKRPGEYFAVFGRVDVVYSDIAQPDQTEIAMGNCRALLKPGGMLMMVIKTRSIDVIRQPDRIIGEETEKLRSEFDVLQVIDLAPYDKDHAMAVARYGG